MDDLTHFAGLDQLAREPHGGNEAVVEAHLMTDAPPADPVPHPPSLAGVAAERFLAQQVFSQRRRREARLSVAIVGGTVDEEINLRVLDHPAPVGGTVFEAVTESRLVHPGG